MQKQLQILRESLGKLDNDAKYSMLFYEDSEEMHGNKFDFFRGALHQTVHTTERHNDCVTCEVSVKAILTKLNNRYHQNQHIYCWQSHMCHFHMSLESWINCPMTCLSEINEFLDKILKGD